MMSEPHHLILPFVLSAILLSPPSCAKPVAEPYQVYIAAGGAPVFSGPGDDYYATQRLPANTECEVYEELRDGWLAIRPPAGSYSLVLRSALGSAEEDVAIVQRDGTPSRVGSVLVDKYSSVHVRLEKDEIVQLIDDGTQDNSQWATIAPPTGEFRFIRETDVVLTRQEKPAEVVDNDRADTTPTLEPISEWCEHATEVDGQSDREPLVRVVAHDDAEPSKTTPPATNSSPAATNVTAFAGKLDQLEIQLSRRVAGPVNLWVFDDLEQRAAQLLSEATTPAEQNQVEDLAHRLSRFGSIASRYRTPPAKSDPTAASIATTTNNATQLDPALSQYDAVGVLRPVVSKQGNAPPYALVDESGNVVTFITPSPTLNLQQHLGQRVGVSGTRGFLPAYRSRNIQTGRVAPLDSPVRR